MKDIRLNVFRVPNRMNNLKPHIKTHYNKNFK